MSTPGKFETYGDYISHLWQTLDPKGDPRTLSRLIAAESCWMQEPDASAATARPDLGEIDGWAEKIEGTKAFGRMMKDPKLGERVAAKDAEGLMTDFCEELTGPARDKSAAPERERAAEKQQRREADSPERKAPEGPALQIS